MKKMTTDQDIQNLLTTAYQQAPQMSAQSSRFVLERWSMLGQQKKQVNIWKGAFLSAAFLLGLVSVLFFQNQKSLKLQNSQNGTLVSTLENYIIQHDFDLQAFETAVAVEVILPENVVFFSLSLGDLKDLRTLTLPIIPKAKGRNALPFVIRTKTAGHHQIIYRLIDANGNKFQQHTMNLDSVESERSI